MDTKICSKCKCDKPLDCFYFKKSESRYNSWCRECLYTMQKARWKSRKKKAVNLFGGKCMICGYCKNYSSLDFHHKNPDSKEYDWKKLRLMSWKSVIHELQKCILICRNCHGELHNPDDLINSDSIVGDNNCLNVEIESTGNCPCCKEAVFGTKFCSKICASLFRRKVERPSRSELIELLRSTNMVQIGKQFGVSDNAVRKWIKYYGI